MSATLGHITIDCRDPFALAGFWAQVFGFVGDPNDPDSPGDDEVLLLSKGGDYGLLFIAVPEPKVVKNRIHLDIVPDDRSRDEEVARLLTLGATLVDDRRRPDGTGWAVLTDPEGNEFCVERSAAERAA